MNLNEVPVYVVHVRQNNEMRRNYILSHLKSFGIKAPILMTEGDISDLTEDVLANYFKGDFKKPSPESSCTVKHLRIAEEIADSTEDFAIVFEDDISLSKNYNELMTKCLEEILSRPDIHQSPYFVSFENSNKFVSRSEQVKGKMLYLKNDSRFAGAYILSKKAAKAIVNYTADNKCHVVSDWYHKFLAQEGIITIYWTHPTFAEQGSHNGNIKSLIDNKKTGWFRSIVWKVQSFIKSKLTRNMR